jgi:hypothetical protein
MDPLAVFMQIVAGIAVVFTLISAVLVLVRNAKAD